jgi:ABC-type uncharacterized transport system permease subunit
MSVLSFSTIAFIAAILLYAAATTFAWRSPLLDARANAPAMPWVSLLAGAIACHFAGLGLVWLGLGYIDLSFSMAGALLAGLIMLIYFLWGRGLHIEQLLARAVAPVALLFVALPVLFFVEPAGAQARSWLLQLHIFVALLGYVLFTIASFHALLMATSEQALHSGRHADLMAVLPPLMRLEGLLFGLLWGAFALLTLTVISGFAFSEALFGQPFKLSNKNVFALLSWLVFATLLFGRVRFGWRGIRAVRFTLLGFGFLVLSYLGSKFLLEVIMTSPH